MGSDGGKTERNMNIILFQSCLGIRKEWDKKWDPTIKRQMNISRQKV